MDDQLSQISLEEPSRLKYQFFLAIAGVADLIDLGAFVLQLLGIATAGIASVIVWVVTTGIDVIANAFLLSYTSGASNRQKKMKEVAETVGRIERNYMRTLKGARRIKFLRGPARKIGLWVAKMRKFPWAKNILAMLADVVPLLEIVPWRTMAVRSIYKNELKAYEEFQPIIQEYKQLEVSLRLEEQREKMELVA